MSVDVRKVAGRRELCFESLDQVVSDAERLVAAPNHRTLGNWPLHKLLTHLAHTIEHSIDGFEMKAPFLIRLLGPLIKRIALKKLSPGIKLQKQLEQKVFPEAGSAEDALERLRAAVARAKGERMEAAHPAFGKMSHDEWIRLHLLHSAMHLSFALPE